MEHIKCQKCWCGILLLLILLVFVSCGRKDAAEEDKPSEDPGIEEPAVEAEATTMSLRKTMGSVRIQDGSEKEVPLLENMGLYSGYCLETRSVSYAWIDLDRVKLAKMDENSEIEIQKEGKSLELLLHAGSLFFHVAEPLDEDESMNIRTSTMSVGIRGTCGWVEESRVYILEGSVEVTASGETAQVSAGEMAEVSVNEDGETEITVLPYAEEYVVPFVLAELEADADLSAAVLDASGLDVLDPPDPVERLKAEYQDIIAEKPLWDVYVRDGLSSVFLIDLDGNGTDELVLVSREAGGWPVYESPITLLEVYGEVQGHAALYGQAEFTGDGDYNSWDAPNYAQLAVSEEGNCVLIHYDHPQEYPYNFRVYGVENGTLVLVDRAQNVEDLAHNYAWSWERTEERNICPELPAKIRVRNAMLREFYGEDNFYVAYARLMDLDQNGTEDLFIAKGEWGDPTVYAVLNEGETIRTVDLGGTGQGAARCSLYRERSTGDIYLCRYWVWGSAGVEWSFTGVSGDTAEYVIESFHEEWLDEDVDVDAARAQRELERQATLNEMDARFELIEEFDGWDDTTVDTVYQQLLQW